MTAFSFVHAADLHLDSPFRGVTAHNPELAEKLTRASFEALANLVDLCIERQADFLVVSGDVFDDQNRSLRAQLAFRDALARLANHGIPAFVAHGNHDPLEGDYMAVELPRQAHVFASGQVKTIRVEKQGRAIAAVSGVSFRQKAETRNLAELFLPADDDLFHVAVLHTNLDGDTGQANYAPCSLADLSQGSADYWALGHVHGHAVCCEDPMVVYPGALQGRTFRETGPHGCCVVTVDENKNPEVEFVALDAVRFAEHTVELTEDQDLAALEQALEEAVETLAALAAPRPLLARLALSGRTPLFHDLSQPETPKDLLERLRETAADREPFAWIQNLAVHVQPAADLLEREKADDLLGQVLREARNLEKPENREGLEQVFQPIFSNRRLSRVLGRFTDQEQEDLLEKARLLCLDLLEGRNQ